MSRGPGTWQRLIVAAVSDGSWRYLVDLLPFDYTPAQYNALNRAALRLVDDGRIGYVRWLCGRHKVAIGPAGAPPPVREAVSGGLLSSCHRSTPARAGGTCSRAGSCCSRSVPAPWPRWYGVTPHSTESTTAYAVAGAAAARPSRGAAIYSLSGSSWPSVARRRR